MNREECLQRMKAPADKRHPAFHSIIQIVVTSCCDKACSNCTYMVKHRPVEHITVDNFRTVCESMVGYPGIVGLIGGNPCVHPKFPELCEIMAEVLPDKAKRGLWTNKLFGHGELARKTFGFFNLNVHCDTDAAREMRRDLPGVNIFGEDKPSIHGAVAVSMKELGIPEEERWLKISNCDINQNWSAAAVQINGLLGGYFCEIASTLAAWKGHHSFAAVIEPMWWRRAMVDTPFAKQVVHFCHDCGVPLRLKGQVDCDEVDDMSTMYLKYPSPKERHVQIHNMLGDNETISPELTDYQRLRTE